MSANYAEGLSEYDNKGKLGQPEKFDSPEEVERKVTILADWLKESQHTVFHTGAGISTSAGIPDFRGPNGVWTLEKKGLKPEINVSWDDARPTLTHMAIVSLEKKGKVQYVVSQNIDGLHLRSGLQRKKLSELHGCMFADKCNYCNRQFVRYAAVTTVGQKCQDVTCPGVRSNGRRCRGKMHDTVLDWEDGLPEHDLDLSEMHSNAADLSISLGTTLQIIPSGNLPVNTKKRGGKFVVVNLQPTKQDRHADLIINTYVDDVMRRLLELLDIPLLQYRPSDDPMFITRHRLQEYFKENDLPIDLANFSDYSGFEPIEWSIQEEWLKEKDLVHRNKTRKIISKKRISKEGKDIEENKKKIKSSTDFVSNDIKKLGSDLESVTDISLENKLKFENDIKLKQNGYKSCHLDFKNSINCEIDPHLKEERYNNTNSLKNEDFKEENGIQFSDPLRMEDCQMEEPNFGENEDSDEIEYLGAISPDGEAATISNNFADKIEIVYVQE